MIANLPRLDPDRPLGHACAMDSLPPPLAFLVLVFAGWVNRQQQAVIVYLLEENRVLRAAHGSRRLRLTDDQRRRLAVKGKVLGSSGEEPELECLCRTVCWTTNSLRQRQP